MSKRLTISKFNTFNTNDIPELDRIETYKTFYKKRFRKLQADESPNQKIIPQNILLKSGQIPFKRSFQKPKEDIIDIKKFQICELWSYKYNHVVQKVSKLNNVSGILEIQKQSQRKSQKYKTQISLNTIQFQFLLRQKQTKNYYIRLYITKNRIIIFFIKVRKNQAFYLSPISPEKIGNNTQSTKNKNVSDFKGKLKELIEICDNAQLFSQNKFSKI
ncbi:unnamed protein product [Paramecium primaurelia]|uniref:Uncharacterized protein n=1 Tax=Paramecium primaurelia TaxID=5886 RepID=A0A8S1PS88_PARPR|nr:unnamed protein product [Paramecium primaurelia]